MKKFIAVLMLVSAFSLSATAGETLKSTRGPFSESYTSIISHGIEFNCLMLNEGDSSWTKMEEEVNGGRVLQRVLAVEMKTHIENQIRRNPNFCRQFAALKDAKLTEERTILTALSESLAARLVDASGRMNLKEMAVSTKPGLSICSNDLVNVAQLNQIAKSCL